ncbi:MAG: DUF1987 domain-containing protein [Bacteroidia bacterium]
MHALNIKKTEYSPSVIYNPTTKQLIFEGESRPENCGKFYEPIIDWITKHIAIEPNNAALIFIFRFDYFNSTSARYIVKILQTVKELAKHKNNTIRIEWNYEKLDEDMLEAGKEFSEVVDIAFLYNEV